MKNAGSLSLWSIWQLDVTQSLFFIKISIMRYLLIAIILLQGLRAHAITREFSVGDTLYVWANDGLMMRKEPRFDSPSLMKLDYGTATVVMERTGGEAEFVVASAIERNQRTLPGISVFGGFVKIHYKGMEGFIFGGFLSRLVPMHNNEPLTDYFNRVYGQLQLIDRSNDHTVSRRVIYKTGIVHEFEGGREKAWFRHLYFIPGISMNEAYLLINRSTGFEEHYKSQRKNATDFDQRLEKFTRDEIVIGRDLGQERIQGGRGYVLVTSEASN
jgi:hypothetical protein